MVYNDCGGELLLHSENLLEYSLELLGRKECLFGRMMVFVFLTNGGNGASVTIVVV